MSKPTHGRSAFSLRQKKKLAPNLAALLAASAFSCAHAQYWTPGPGELTLSPPAPDNVVYAMIDDGGSGFYAGGQFTAPYSAVAHWDGTQWKAVGLAGWDAGSTAYALIEYNGTLYAGGSFIDDPNPAVEGDELHYGLVEYNDGEPGNWTPVGSHGEFLDGVVYALAEYNGMLVLGGDFTAPNGNNNISAWDGTEWVQLGGGNGSNGTIYALATMHGEQGFAQLYAGGDFTNIGSAGSAGISLPEENLAMFNGSGWSQSLGAANGVVKALYAVDSGTLAGLYIGGWFDRIGSHSGLGYLARWNGWAIDDMNGGTNGVVEAFTAFYTGSLSSRIAVGGNFSLVDSTINVQNVAAWNASGWAVMDTGVSDGSSRPGAVKALCSAPGGCYAGGDIAQCGTSFQMSDHVARFRDYSSLHSLEEFMDAITHGTLEAMEGPYWRFWPYDVERPAACVWGVSNASFQRLAWDPSSLEVGERLDLSIDEAERGTFDISIWKEQGSGPFLPPHEVFEFTPHDLAPGSAISILVLSADGLIEYGFIEAPLESGRIEIDGSVIATTISNGFFWNKGEVAVVELSEGSSITAGGGSISNVTAFGVVWEGTEKEMVSPFDLELYGDLILDASDCGFGFQDNLHHIEAAQGFSIESDSLVVDMNAEGILDVLAVIDGFAANTEGLDALRSEMSFSVEAAETDWSLTMTANMGIYVGNPLQASSSLTLEGRDADTFAGHFRASDENMNQPHFVKLMHMDEVIAEFVIPTGYLEFTTSGVGDNGLFNAGFDSANDSSSLNWTAPGLVVFSGGGNLPPIQGPTGLIIGKTEGSDGDDIWDVLQQTSLSVTTERPMRLRILEELFRPYRKQAEDTPGDINGDGRVDGQDLAELLGAWGSDDANADINGDGVVNGQDLAELLGRWN